MKQPQTLQEAIVYFSDPERAFVAAVNLRWPDKHIICPRCSGESHSFIKTRRLWFCKGCKRQFTVKVGSIFEDSALGLDKWMIAVWMICNCKNGVSSYEIARNLGVTQKSAWFMLQRIRTAMGDRKFAIRTKLGGAGSECEADETYIGGKAKNMHKDRRLKLLEGGRGVTAKTAVHGILDRNLRQVRATVVPNVYRDTLQAAILNNIKYGSTLYTDEAPHYDGISYKFVHDVVNHSMEYVRGRVHTNGIENFWSLLKRGLKGTYVAVEPFHLFRYVDEQVFRFNNRKDKSDYQRFALAMNQVSGKRLTYEQLTGKSDSPRTSSAGAGQAEPF